MAIKNGKNRTTKVGQGHKGGKPESQPRSMGDVPAPSAKHGTYQIGVGGKDSNESNTVVTGEQSSVEIGGKLIRQLVNENERQLAYHKQQAEYHEQQAELLKQRIEDLRQIPENPTE
jgi:hypothetical protein